MSTMFINDYNEIELNWFQGNRYSAIAQRAVEIKRFCSAQRFLRRLAQWQAIREFEALDDQYLQDIGIERYEIKEFVQRGGR